MASTTEQLFDGAGRRSRSRRTRPGSTATPATAARPLRRAPACTFARSPCRARPELIARKVGVVARNASIPSTAGACGPNRGRRAPSAVTKPPRSPVRSASTSSRASQCPVPTSNADRVGSGSPGPSRRPLPGRTDAAGCPSVVSQEPPRSTREPARSTVCSRPPTRPRASRPRIHTGATQRVGHREPRDPRTHDEDPLHRLRDSAGGVGAAVIESAHGQARDSCVG